MATKLCKLWFLFGFTIGFIVGGFGQSTVNYNFTADIPFKTDPSSTHDIVHKFTQNDSNYYVTKDRLIRIHQTNHEFYIEIPFGKKVIAAYSGLTKPQILSGMEYHKDQFGLYLSFETETQPGSSLHVYSISMMNEAFEKTINQCKEMPAVKPKDPSLRGTCRRIRPTIGGRNLDNYFESLNPMEGYFIGDFTQMITALVVALQGRKLFGYLGTGRGEVMEVFLRLNGSSIILMTEKLSERSPVSAIEFDNEKNNLNITTGNNFTLFPLTSCAIYKTCHQCLTATLAHYKPECGWCGNKCAIKEECENPSEFKKNSCPPEKFTFHPNSGPLEGGTKITMEGNNFGTNKAEIMIGNIPCKKMAHNFTKIECKTSAVNASYSQPINLRIVDMTRQSSSGGLLEYILRGHIQSGQLFTYKNPEVYKFHPAYGPFAGGTKVKMIGKDLDIGSTTSVFMNAIECKIIRKTVHHIECITGPVTSIPHEQFSGPVKIVIDNKILTVKNKSGQDMVFSYKQNPIVKDIQPRFSILSGDDISVHGRHFSSIDKPRMITTVMASSDHMIYEFPLECQKISSDLMTCPTANLTFLNSDPANFVSLTADISFVMDGVLDLRNLFKFTYYPNPVIYSISEIGEGKMLDVQERNLEIKGEYVNSINFMDRMKVLIEDKSCNITSLNKSILMCTLPDGLPINSKLAVEIICGRLRVYPGFIELFETTDDSDSVHPAFIATPISVFLIIMAIIACAVCYWKFFKPKSIPPNISAVPLVSQGDVYQTNSLPRQTVLDGTTESTINFIARIEKGYGEIPSDGTAKQLLVHKDGHTGSIWIEK